MNYLSVLLETQRFFSEKNITPRVWLKKAKKNCKKFLLLFKYLLEIYEILAVYTIIKKYYTEIQNNLI